MKINKKNSINYGIELLRLISMLMIVTLHTLGEGGLLTNSTGINYKIYWLLEIFGYCCVNIFAIITGYVNYSEKEKKNHYLKFISFWIPIFFYSIGIYIFTTLYQHNSLSITALIKSLFPVTTSTYWYINAYVGLFFIIPWLNKAISKINNKDLDKLVLTLFLVFSLYASFACPFSDPFLLKHGYSFIWLTILYIFGAWIKKNSIEKIFSTKLLIANIIIYPLINWIWKIWSPILSNLFVCYLSPLVLIPAISLVLLFIKLKTNNTFNKIIAFLSSSTLSIYLIHNNHYFSNLFIRDKFIAYLTINPLIGLLKTIITICIIFIICLIIDKIRMLIFKILRINDLIELIKNLILKIENKIKSIRKI